jgi:broad-specificity NMP kinase
MAAEKEKEEALAEIAQTIENEQREAGEKIAEYCVKIEEKENTIKKIEDKMEEIVGKIEDSQPRFEMNTALLDFITLLLILRDNIHFSLMDT